VAEVSLFLADFFKSRHDTTERVNFSGWLVNLELDLLDIVIEALKHGVGLLVEIFGVTSLPLADPFFEGILDVRSLERKSTELMGRLNGINFLRVSLEFLQFVFVVLKLGVARVEFTELIIHLGVPEP
jgi:hypothetical protein